MTILFASACGLAAAASPPDGIDSRGLIELALDEPARVTLENVKLCDAIDRLSEQTGVRIFMPADVIGLTPYGADTVVERIEMQNVSLRAGLAELLAPLGMTFFVADNHVAVEPVEAIRCLGRAPTWNELDTLAELSAMQPGVNEEDLDRLRGRVQFQIPSTDGWAALAREIRGIGAGTGDEVLSLACAKLGWGWCFSDRRIIVMSGVNQIRNRLQQPVSLRMNFRPLIDVLQALGREAGVPIRTEPGALTSLPLQVQKNFSLLVQHAPAEQVLEKIAAATSLGYLIESDGVLFFRMAEAPPAAGNSSDQPAAPTTGLDPYVGKIVIPLGEGKSVEWLIRRSELPADLREMRDRDLERAFETIRLQATNERPE